MKLCPAAQALYNEGLALAEAYRLTSLEYASIGDDGRASGAEVQRNGALRGMTRKLEKHRWRCDQCG